jgi:hypothetical protein
VGGWVVSGCVGLLIHLPYNKILVGKCSGWSWTKLLALYRYGHTHGVVFTLRVAHSSMHAMKACKEH